MKNSLLSVLLVPLFSISVFAHESHDSKEIPLIPVKTFFKTPDKLSYQLSPDGEYISYLEPWNKRLNVTVQKIGSSKTQRITNATERDLAGFFWKGNNRIIYLQDSKGDENFRLYGINKDGKNPKDLTPFPKTTVQVIDDLEDNENEMIIALNKDNKEIFDVYRINVHTGKMTLIEKNPGNITEWITDHNGKLRIAVTTDGVKTSILYRKDEKDKFKNVITTSFKDNLSPLFFTPDNKYVYASSNLGRDKNAIVKYDLENNKELELIYQNPEVDVNSLLYSKKRKVITGTAFTTWKRQYKYFDKQMKSLQETIEKKLPNYEVSIGSTNKNEDKYLIRTYSDKSMGAYYFYNTKTKDFRKLSDISPWLNENYMSEMKPIKYKSRDGLEINGYLTLPKGKIAKNLPVVVNPHGGPWARDRWGFNPEVQFLANRGYAVLQMNFRGSTGYGRKFWESSFKQWGKTMQNDITDGVDYLIKSGVANPKKIGIYGGSYGGYATLAGLTFTPDLYACGIDYVGVSNLFTFMKSIPPYWKPMLEMLYEQVGNPEKDEELLRSASPVFHADKIKVPLFIAQGAKDPRVNKDESDQMVKALKDRGINVQYMVKDNEGHGFHNEENRIEFYNEMQKFLAKYLGGKSE